MIRAAHPELAEAEVWDKICVIDTENRSASLYSGAKIDGLAIGAYNVIELRPPFLPKNYLEAIQVAEDAGIEFLIIDSLTHAWTGEGGMLEIHGNITERTKNSYTAWREVTPLHNQLVDKILQCDMHVCVCLRAKVEYVLEEGANGKKLPVKKGMAPIFREGLEFELTTFFEVAQNHTACTTKDRTGLFDGEYFVITPKTGARVYDWLSESMPTKETERTKTKTDSATSHPRTDAATEETPEQTTAREDFKDTTDLPITPEQVDRAIKAYCASMDKAEKLRVAAEIKAITGGIVNCLQISDPDVLCLLYQKFNDQKEVTE